MTKDTVIIFEKPDAGRAGEKAGFGGLAARGHLFGLAPPEEYGFTWAEFDFRALRPAKFANKPKSDKDAKSRLSRLKSALASARNVVIATDDDREGERIAWDILDHFRFKGAVQRAIFAAIDPVSLQKAFGNLRPAEEFRSRALASAARDKADWIWGMTTTRALTKALVPVGVRFVVKNGRVKGPTAGIVCRRELEILNFKPEDYFRIAAHVDSGRGISPGICDSGTPRGPGRLTLIHSPKEKIVGAGEAERIRGKAEAFEGPISVATSTKRAAPPLMHSFNSLLSDLGGKGWSAKEVTDVAQTLYQRGITTYPGTDGEYLPESQAPDIERIVPALLGLETFGSLTGYGTPCRAAFSEAKLAKLNRSHHAIVPNVNTIADLEKNWAGMNAREREMFLAVASQYLAALGGDEVYLSTKASIDVEVEGTHRIFEATGKVVREHGWTAVPGVRRKGKEPDRLPEVEDGQQVRVAEAEVLAEQTKPPSRFTEGSLSDEMMVAHKYVTDPEKKKMLRGVEGIGRPRTRGPIIEEIKAAGLVRRDGKFLRPTDAGMGIFQLMSANPVLEVLVDPGETAIWEGKLDLVEKGDLSEAVFLDQITAEVDRIAREIESLPPMSPDLFVKLGGSRTEKGSGPGRSRKGGQKTKAGSRGSRTSSRPGAKTSPKSASGERIYLKVPYEKRGEAKALGARWDGDRKQWYVPEGKDPGAFGKWK